MRITPSSTFAFVAAASILCVACISAGKGAADPRTGTASDKAVPSLLVAVSPFTNLTGEAAEDYIGFQVSEY